MATVAHTIPLAQSNRESLLRRLWDRFLPDGRIAAGEARCELALLARRSDILDRAADSWHPLQTQSIVARTLCEPLQALMPHLPMHAAQLVDEALLELSGLMSLGDTLDAADERDVNAALTGLGDASSLLDAALREWGA